VRSFALFWNSALTLTPLVCFACLVLQLFYVLENFDITAKAMDQSSAYYLAEATDAASSSSQPALLLLHYTLSSTLPSSQPVTEDFL